MTGPSQQLDCAMLCFCHFGQKCCQRERTSPHPQERADVDEGQEGRVSLDSQLLLDITGKFLHFPTCLFFKLGCSFVFRLEFFSKNLQFFFACGTVSFYFCVFSPVGACAGRWATPVAQIPKRSKFLQFNKGKGNTCRTLHQSVRNFAFELEKDCDLFLLRAHSKNVSCFELRNTMTLRHLSGR